MAQVIEVKFQNPANGEVLHISLITRRGYQTRAR